MRVAVIPARGGSKRIPDKNIKMFNGKPIIGWSIEAAKTTNLFDRIVVSTDSEKIARIAVEFGAEVPFLRPAELSNDYVPITPVVVHAIEWLIEHGIKPAEVCCISATAPFIRADDIAYGLSALSKTSCDFVLSVTAYGFPIQRAVRITQNRIKMFNSEYFLTRSQDLEPAYHDAAQFYWGGMAAWLAGRPLFSDHSAPIILPRYRVQDIDTLEDWKQAELMFRAIRGNT